MARQCVLHFGMHKTGSTSIQKSLFHLTAEVPWVYINGGKPNASVALHTMFAERPETNHRNVRKGLSVGEVLQRKQDYFRRMETQIAATDKDLLLSSEGMTVLSEMELERLLDWVRPFVDEIVAVGYVRAPKAYMESAFQQIVKGGRSDFNLKAVYPNYRKKFEKFEKLLGRDKVEYWLFDPKAFPDGCVVRDFAARLGVTLEDGDVQRVNESISMEALALLYAYRKYGEGYGVGEAAIRENTLLIRKLAEIKGHKLRFSPDLVRPILDEHRADIAWMEERLGRSFNEDWDAHAEHEVTGEADMLKFGEESLTALRQWVGEPAGHDDTSSTGVARLVASLRCRLAEEHNRPGALPGKVQRWLKRRLRKPARMIRQLGCRLFAG